MKSIEHNESLKQTCGFPDIIEWQNTVMRQGDDEQYKRSDFYEYYKIKYEICKKANPLSICEIGVRWGYSAYSFLSAAPSAFYCGLDIIEGTHGGAKGIDTFEYVYKLLGENFPAAAIVLKHCNSQKITTLGGPWDFIHIDGDHSVEGCRHDLGLAMSSCRAGGTILVDDYNYIKGVTVACDEFAEKNADEFVSIESRHSLRGEMILKKKKKELIC
jgi:predicted O-methyltransferase YrrM